LGQAPNREPVGVIGAGFYRPEAHTNQQCLFILNTGFQTPIFHRKVWHSKVT